MAMLSYRIRKATTGVAPHPCILLLHYGSNADDLFYFAGYLPDQLTVISLEAPLDTPHLVEELGIPIHFDATQDKWSDLKEAEKSLVDITQPIGVFYQRI